MRHRKDGRKLGRNPKHQRALLRNLAISLLMTEREYSDKEIEDMKKDGAKPPKVPGRIVTTIEKAKEVRPLVEKCVTLARKAQKHLNAALQLESKAERGTSQWKAWRESAQWQEWNKAVSPALALRRRAFQILGDKEAVSILFDKLGPRFEDRDGGYTRILRLAKPRLGDAGTRAILEFVGENDRVKKKSVVPTVEE